MRKLQCLLASIVIGSAIAQGIQADDQGSVPLPVRQLPREDQLLYHDAQGEIRTARTIEEWKLRKQESLRGLIAVMGELPGDEKRCPLDVDVLEEVDCGTYVRRKMTIQSEPGCRVPAYLLIPKTALQSPPQPAAGVLCLHPTRTAGPEHIVGLGLEDAPKYAKELAERGFVTIVPAYPLLGEYQPDLKQLGWKSGSLKAVWDNMRCLDLLDSMQEVRHGKYAAIGHSLGGHNSVYTALFDDRIQVIVTCCGLDSYVDYYNGNPEVWKPERGWVQERYMARLAGYAGRLEEIPCDFQEMISALAPRRVLIVAPLKDSNFRHESVDRVVEAARSVYRLHQVPENLTCEHPDGVHEFSSEMRDKAYEIISTELR